MNGEWRAMVDRSSYGPLALGRVHLLVAFRETDGTIRPVVPVELVPGEPLEPGAHVYDGHDRPTLDIPRELAEVLLSALARELVGEYGDADLLATLRRTERERDDARRQLDKLIDGIGRLGGNRS